MSAEATGADGTDQRGRWITIETPQASRRIHLTPKRLAILGCLGVVGVGWSLVASAGFLIAIMSPTPKGMDLSLIDSAHEQDVATLSMALEGAQQGRATAEERLDLALDQIIGLQSQLEIALLAQDELSTSFADMRDKLARAVDQRDAAEARAEEMMVALNTIRSETQDGGDNTEELEVVLSAVSDALESAVRARDTHRSELLEMESEIATMELRMQINADRQEQLVASLEGAVQTSFGPLETMFRNSGMDVDSLIAGVRRGYSGIGGVDGTIPASVSGLADPELNERFSALIKQMDRMNSMRIAATNIPYVQPVRQAVRFTSGFGTRRDPKTGGRRAHNGIDLAGPLGTPILATADGTVIHASRQSGFGLMVKIRHSYGFETVYAHLNKIHVKVGDRIARGDHIGDMGTTGRSTGVHLHYEVRLGGKPVNPMTYIKAARDVF